MNQEHVDFEALNQELNNPDALENYKKPFDNYQTKLIPKILGGILVFCGNFVYGKKPSYEKFKAVEVIARVPYHSWASAAYTFLTVFYSNEVRAIELSNSSTFSRFAQDNETMHVVVISQIVKQNHGNKLIKHTLIPMFFSFFYFWAAYVLYMFSPRYAMELNYLFEQHAFDQYDEFLQENEASLKSKIVKSDFIHFYGRNPRNEYDLFLSIRNDEIVHRNRSIREIEMRSKENKIFS